MLCWHVFDLHAVGCFGSDISGRQLKIGANNNVPYKKRTAYASSIKIPADSLLSSLKFDLPGFQLNIKSVA